MAASEYDKGLVAFGWAAVPRSHSRALYEVDKNNHANLDLDRVKVPDTPVAKRVLEYAESTLPERTFNHSMRVWYYGMDLPHLILPLCTVLHDLFTSYETDQIRKCNRTNPFPAPLTSSRDLLPDLFLARRWHDPRAHEGHASFFRVLGCN
jgi:hypothetical protein